MATRTLSILLAVWILSAFAGQAAVNRDEVAKPCSQLAPPATGGDREARVALKATVDRAAHSSSETDRRVVAAALIEALTKATDVDVQDFLLEYLRFVASPAEVPAVARFLLHERLSDRAIAVLVTVREPAAEQALLATLPKAPPERAAALLKALGDIGSTGCVAEGIKRVEVTDAGLRSAALYALARSGEPRAGAALKARLSKDDAAAAYLRYGERLAELGQLKDAAAVAAALPDKAVGLRCGKLALLATTLGVQAQPTLIAALDDPDRSVREQAVRQLARLKGERLTKELAEAARAAKGAKRVALLDAVSRRADVWSPSVFIEALKDEDADVQRIAIQALQRVGSATAAQALLPMGDQPEVRAALIAMRGQGVDAAIAKALATPATRVTALEILAKRRAALQAPAIVPLAGDPDAKVSQAACDALAVLAGAPELEQLVTKALATDDAALRQRLTKPISAAAMRLDADDRNAKSLLAALPGAKPELRDWILARLPAFGGPGALDAVVKASASTDAPVREVCVRALADWRDEEAVEPLVALVHSAGDERLRVLAARGAVRLIEQAAWEKAEKVAKLKPLVEAAPRAEEKQLVEAAIKRVEAADQPPRRKKKK